MAPTDNNTNLPAQAANYCLAPTICIWTLRIIQIVQKLVNIHFMLIN